MKLSKLQLGRKSQKDEGPKSSEEFASNRMLYHKTVKDVRGKKAGQTNRIRDKNGKLLIKGEEVIQIWIEYFEEEMASGGGEEADFMLGKERGGRRVKGGEKSNR